jgi:hypothetical protein
VIVIRRRYATTRRMRATTEEGPDKRATDLKWRMAKLHVRSAASRR